MIAKIMSGTLARLLSGYFMKASLTSRGEHVTDPLELLGEVLDIIASGRSSEVGESKVEGHDVSYMWDMRVRMANITSGLGVKLKSKAIAALYIARTDISNVRRQSALKV